MSVHPQLYRHAVGRLLSRRWHVMAPRCLATKTFTDADTPGPSNETENAVEDLLHKSTTFLDHNNVTFEDAWPSSPYPNAPSTDISDSGEVDKIEQLQADETTVVLFPGQGTQSVGMGAKLLKYEGVRPMFASASSILGFDLLDLCLNGPLDRLSRTKFQQSAILVCSLASMMRMKEEHPAAIENCTVAAGYSVGEIAALVFAGSLSFEAAIQLVKVRAEAMQEASELCSSGLMRVMERRRTIMGHIMQDAVKAAWPAFKERFDKPLCQTSAYLFPQCRVIGGHTECLDYIEANTQKYFLRPGDVRRLPVSGAFHTPLMKTAREPLADVVARLEIRDPVIPVYSCYSGAPMTTAKEIKLNIVKQITKAVKWQQIIHTIYARGQGERFPATFEVGPGKQLGTILNRSNLKAFKFYASIDC